MFEAFSTLVTMSSSLLVSHFSFSWMGYVERYILKFMIYIAFYSLAFQAARSADSSGRSLPSQKSGHS